MCGYTCLIADIENVLNSAAATLRCYLALGAIADCSAFLPFHIHRLDTHDVQVLPGLKRITHTWRRHNYGRFTQKQ